MAACAAYRSQADAEFGFRQLKDPTSCRSHPDAPLDRPGHPSARLHLCPGPANRAPDRRQATQAGLPLSVRELLAPLASIQETVLIYPSTADVPRAAGTSPRPPPNRTP